MKSILAIALVLVLTIATFCGCGGADAPAPTAAPTEASGDSPTEAPVDPTGAPADEPEKKYASLEELVASEEFLSAMPSANSQELETSVAVENGDTVVFSYNYIKEFSDQDMTLLKFIWDATMKEEGPGIIEKIQQAVTDGMGENDCSAVIRLIDSNGNIVSEYPAN